MSNLGICEVTGKGRGIIALINFCSGQLVEKSPLIVLNENIKSYLEVGSYCFPYWFDDNGIPNKHSERFVLVFGHCSLINHSFNPNARWEINPHEKVLSLYAITDIIPGSEITMNYGVTKIQFDRLGWIP
jgi:hypothetical protein